MKELLSPFITIFRRVLNSAWTDKATRYSFAGQFVQLLSGPVALLLIVSRLSEAEQGIYYAFGSILMLKSLFDLGFSFAIIQSFAHEFAHLSTDKNGLIVGSGLMRQRLGGFFAFSRKWCLGAGLLFIPLVGWGGFIFLRNSVGESVPDWTGPWWCLSTVTAGNLGVAFWGLFLAGTGRIGDSYRISLIAEITGNILLICLLWVGAGLWAPAMLAVTRLAVYLFECIRVWRKQFVQMWRLANRCGAMINFKTEILPFQARLAASWTLGYFTSYLFTPAVLYFQGPGPAGRFGAAAQIVNMIGAISATWISVKAPSFGTLTAQGNSEGLRQLFKSITLHSILTSAVMLAAAVSGLLVLTYIDAQTGDGGIFRTKLHTLVTRFSGADTILIYGLGMVGGQYLNAAATCLRARKEEPFLGVMGIQAFITLLTILLFVPSFGETGAAMSYGFSMIITCVLAFMIFRKNAYPTSPVVIR